MDLIILESLECQTFLGVGEEERAKRQRVWIDLELEVDLSHAAAEGSPETSVDYAKVYDLVLKLAQEKPRRLVESLAAEVADLILYAFPEVQSARVRVWKKPAELRKVRRVAAEVNRRR